MKQELSGYFFVVARNLHSDEADRETTPVRVMYVNNEKIKRIKGKE